MDQIFRCLNVLIYQYSESTFLFPKFKKKTVWWLRVKENRISTENSFNRDYFGNGVYISSDNDPKTLSSVIEDS